MKTELSDGEWTLMQRLWEVPYSTITELTAAMRQSTGWSKHTILSMLARMEAKGAIAYQQSGRAKAWYPLVRQSDAVRKETRRFLDRVYGGSVGLMVNAMADSRDLSPEDIAELSRILERAKEERQ